MIPVERVTELLAGHRLAASCAWRAGTAGFRAWCACGWNSDEIPDSEIRGGKESPAGIKRHAAHVAGVLADAGLIPTQREWGVRDPYSVIEFRGNEHAARTFAGGGADTIVSRWVGATEWEATNE